jgi:hypothetical protein
MGAILLAASPLVAGCSFSSDSCAGQCKAPFQLDVIFHDVVGPTAVKKALAACATLPTVVRTVAVPPAVHQEGWNGRVFTSKLGRDADTAPLLDCLDRQPDVESAGWPS